MKYKIAIGSSDGEKVDLKFGEVSKFIIYEVDGEQYRLHEIRSVITEKSSENELSVHEGSDTRCGSGGCQGNGNGCSGPSDILDKVALIEDCRCVVCKKIGFQAQKQFEKKAISVFDVECEVSEALSKIIFYYSKLDNHESIGVRK